MRRSALLAGAAGVLLVGAGAASAQPPTCQQQLDQLTADWKAIDLQVPSKPAQQRSTGRMGHEHSGSEVTFMRDQVNLASHLCKQGNEHEAMLRMDVVRAWLKLPEVSHPADHRYSMQPTKGRR